MVSLNMYVEPEQVEKIQMCILLQVRYLTVEYDFIIKCDVCNGKISVFVNHGF